MRGHVLHPPGPNPELSDLRHQGLLFGIIVAAALALAMFAVRFRAPQAPGGDAQSASFSRVSATDLRQVGLLLDRSRALDLTPTQVSSLTRLNELWAREQRDLDRAIAVAERAARERLRSAHGESGVSVGAIVAGSTGPSPLSERYSSRRMHYWNRALSMLTPEQREVAGSLSVAAR